MGMQVFRNNESPKKRVRPKSGDPSERALKEDPAPTRQEATFERTTPPKAAPKPEWYPPDFNTQAVASGLKAFIRDQNPAREEPSPAKDVLVVDWDHTTAETMTPAQIFNSETGHPLMHPRTGQPVVVGVGPHRNADRELAELQAEFPDLPCTRPDFPNAYEGREAFLASKPIPETTNEIRRSNGNPQSRAYVLTARENVYSFGIDEDMRDYLAQDELHADGILAPNAPEMLSAIPQLAPLQPDQRKAVVISGLADIHRPQTQMVLDDSASNVRRTLELVPALHPEVQLEVRDLAREDGAFRHVPVAHSPAHSTDVIAPSGNRLTANDIQNYQSPPNEPFDLPAQNEA